MYFLPDVQAIHYFLCIPKTEKVNALFSFIFLEG